MADTLIFLDIKGIEGDSTINGFEGKIELESASFGMKAEHTAKAGPSKVSTKLTLERLSVTKFFDKASPNLSKFLAKRDPTGKTRHPLTQVILHYVDLQIEEGGAKPVPVLKIVFSEDCYIESIGINASESGKSISVKETVQISYRKIELSYYPISDATGDGITQRKSGAKTFIHDMKTIN